MRSSYVLLATNVAETIKEMTKDEFDVYRDLPNIAPSFKNMFIEWSSLNSWGPNHYGLLINSTDRNEVPEADCWKREFGGVDARWSCNAFLFQFTESKDNALYLGHLFWGVGPLGQFTDHHLIVKEYPRIEVGDVVKGMAVSASDAWFGTMKQRHPEFNAEDVGLQMLSLARVPLMALCFLHAKNVAVKKSAPPTVHEQRAWRKRDKPFFRYHTITIHSGATRAIGGGRTGPHGSPAVHICRGHFKRFTAEKPLLGKHVGIYWWPMILRGLRRRAW